MPATIPLSEIKESAAIFWHLCSKGADSECWRWDGPSDKEYGYPVYEHKGRPYAAHRIAYALHHDFDPSYALSRSCKMRLCCNPAHYSERKDNGGNDPGFSYARKFDNPDRNAGVWGNDKQTVIAAMTMPAKVLPADKQSRIISILNE